MSKLLIPEQPLQILPSLAKAIGLNEAIFLQQLHYWLRKSKHEHDGKVWIYNTFEEWHEQLPFWSLRTMQRIVKSLVDQKLVDVHQFGAADWDRKNWYAIEYDKLAEIERQIDLVEHAKLSPSKRTKRRTLEGAKLSSSLTETTTEKEPTESTTREGGELPFGSEEFQEAFKTYESYRQREIKKPLKPIGRGRLLSELSEMGEHRAIAALNHSMANGWTGVFEPRNGNGHRVEGLDAVREVLSELEH